MYHDCKKKQIFHSKSRRRGQALVLSVLIMIFIVLLATTFISIVASNMSNTARTGAKDAARQAAKAGLDFADTQLTGSAIGLEWRPELPTSTNIDLHYYSPLDRAQGWNQAFPTDSTARFVKYPNHRADSTLDSQQFANFMLRVSTVKSGDPDNSDDVKTGDIRIESVGFAEDDPAVYYSAVAYKRGLPNSVLTSSARSISNWDWGSNTVPYATVIEGDSESQVIIANNESSGLKKDDIVTVYDPFNNELGTTKIANMESPEVPHPTTQIVTFTPPLEFTPGRRSIIQKAAKFGIPDNSEIKFDNVTDTPVSYRVSALQDYATGDSTNAAGSLRVNGGLIWSGNVFLNNLVADANNRFASNIQSSGVFTTTDNTESTPTTANVMASDDSSNGTLIPASSVDDGFNGNAAVDGGLIVDGLNRLRGSSDPSRQVEDFTPPDITKGGDGFGRYRQLTLYSKSTDLNYPQASAYGFGQGIYINNPDDVEKKGTDSMSQDDLQKLWYDAGNIDSEGAQRLQRPAAASATNKSLEEQHMRGWVSPDQFLPRGAEVVINDDDSITINLDPLADNTTGTYNHANFASSTPTPNPKKAWREKDGILSGDENTGGVYSRTFAWPENGTIFAEGNIRIRGVSNNATRSLTVVSMNNIYIEGSVKLNNNKKVLLLAKKNVIVNPTLALAPVQAVTTLSADATGATDTINVYDTANFAVGDYITFAYSNATVHRILNKDANSLELDPALSTSTSTARTEGSPVYTVFDPRMDAGYVTSTWQNRPYNRAIRLTRFSNAIQRRVWYPHNTAPTNLRLAFRHSAEYKKAMTLKMNEILAQSEFDEAEANEGALSQERTDLEIAAATNKALGEGFHGQSVITPGEDADTQMRNKYLKIKYREAKYTRTRPNTSTAWTENPEPAREVKTDIFPSDRDKDNEITYTDNAGAPPYPFQSDAASLRQAADNISIGHMYKQMIDRHAKDAASAEYDKSHWRYNEFNADPAQENNGVQINNNYWKADNRFDVIDHDTVPGDFDTDNANHPRYYFMAGVGNKVSPYASHPNEINPDFSNGGTIDDDDASPHPLREAFYDAPEEGLAIPMATSVWAWVNGEQAILQDNTFHAGLFSTFADGLISDTFGKVMQFGFSPILINRDDAGDPIIDAADYRDYADWEDSLTVDQYFYQPRTPDNIGNGVENLTVADPNDTNAKVIGTSYKDQTEYDTEKAGDYKVNYTLDSRLVSNVSVGDYNSVSLSLNDGLVDPENGRNVDYYFSAKTLYNQNLDDFYNIPYYRLSNLKLQNEIIDDTSHELSGIGTAKTFEINAYVYAQEGGWQVIPGDYFDADVKNGDVPENDLNRDGTVSPDEQLAAYRYHRYNYQIVFNGSIMENQTASMAHVGDWMDKWATVKMDVSDTLTYDDVNPANSNFNTILYYYDPTAAEVNSPLDFTDGFQVPVTPGLIYQK